MEVSLRAGQTNERHFTEVSQKLVVALTKLAHEKRRWRAFEAALLNTRDDVADQSSLSANARRFLFVVLRTNKEEIFMVISDHVRAEGFVFHMNTSEHCGVIKTTVRVGHEDCLRVIAKDYGVTRFCLSTESRVTLRMAFFENQQ